MIKKKLQLKTKSYIIRTKIYRKFYKWNKNFERKKMNLFIENKFKQTMFFLFKKIITVKKQTVALKIQKKQKKFNKVHEK